MDDGSADRFKLPFYVGSWYVEPLRLVLVDDAGREAAISQRAMSVLAELARAGGAVVQKYDLMDAVWGQAEVSDGALSQSIFELRHALGDDPQHPRFIETIRGVGFRLIPTVRSTADGPSLARRLTRSRLRLAMAAALMIVAAILVYLTLDPVVAPPLQRAEKSIAVLPFENRSDREADRYFTDGIHEDLLRHIAHIRDIKTIARTSVMGYRGTTKNMRTIGQELGVATVLEGSVQRAGDRIRINVKLIDSGTDTQLWAKAYTRQLTVENVFAIQSEIASDVARSLEAILTPDEQQRLLRVPTSSLEALSAYFRGKDARNLGTHEAIRKSVTHFQRAIEWDPTFADAHADLAYTLMLQILFSGLPADVQTSRALPHIERALELDPLLDRAHVALGYLHDVRLELDLAATAYARALELNPNSIIALRSYGHLLHWSVGRPGAAVTYFERALELAPGAEGIRQQLAEALIDAGRDLQGETMIRGVIEENPDNALALRVLGSLLSRNQGRIDEAILAYRAALAVDPHGWLYAVNIAVAYEMLGDGPEAARWLDYAIMSTPDSVEAPAFRSFAAHVRGDHPEALRRFRTISVDSVPYRFLRPRIAWSLHLAGDTKAGLELILKECPLFDSAEPLVEPNQLEDAAYAVHMMFVMGRPEQAERLAAAALEVAESMPRASQFGRNWWPAVLRMDLGDNAGAVRELERYVDAGGLDAFLVESAIWQPLREDPGYRTLSRSVSERLAAQRQRLVEMEARGELASISPPAPEPTKRDY